nr:MAG TPA: Minor capsid protein from bacteriophage [Caudoviricetes sp.]
MTISEAISKWLAEYGEIVIETNHVSDGSDKYGLFKSPQRNIVSHVDYSYEITEYYQLLARLNSLSEDDRKDSDELLEKLTYWADDYPFIYEYPVLDGNRQILNISVTGSPYALSTDSSDTVYQLSIEITYTREREGL